MLIVEILDLVSFLFKNVEFSANSWLTSMETSRVSARLISKLCQVERG